ncbi:MAG: hypothetical protein ACLRNW_21950 [Neglectibacter sp.]
MERDPEEMIWESMAPVRQVAIDPCWWAELEEINWEPVKLEDPRLRSECWKIFANRFDRQGQSYSGRSRLFRTDSDSWQVSSITRWTIWTFKTGCKNRASPCPRRTRAYLCGGECRTLFPWGDGLDYSMRLRWFEDMDEDENRPYDMEEPNFRPVYRLRSLCGKWCRLIDLPPAAVTAGAISAAAGPISRFLQFCSPHCKPEVQEDKEPNGDYDFTAHYPGGEP